MAGNDSNSYPGFLEMGLSHVSMPGPPLRSITIGQLVEDNSQKWGDSEFLYDVPTNTRLTFAQLKKEVDLLASGLMKIGLAKGDRIGIWAPNDFRWIITYLAAAKVGIVIVPLNPMHEASELLYALNYMSIKCLVMGQSGKTRDLNKILNKAVPDISIQMSGESQGSRSINSTVAPHLKQIVYWGNEPLKGTHLWEEVQTMGQEEGDLEKMRKVAQTVQSDDILHVIFTSGTTGRPKGAMISHNAHINCTLRIGKYFCSTREDRHCVTPHLSPLLGIWLGILHPLCFGSGVLIPSPTFSPSSAITITAKEKCNWLYGTPTMHSDMLNVPGLDQLDLSSLKRAFVVGAPPSKTLIADMVGKYGIAKVTIGYGMTEAFALTVTLPQDPPELSSATVGYPLENVEIKIIGTDGGTVPVGQTGEICGRTYSLMQGYWEDPEKTREVIDPARWYHTGDAGYFLESGHLVVAGRFKDMLIRGGENIYPKEIEDFLYENLAVKEVHVFGVGDERLGEVVAAWVLPKSGVTMDLDKIKEACEGKISRRKIPAYVKFLEATDEFPRSIIGKGQKNVMRQLFEKELGLGQPVPVPKSNHTLLNSARQCTNEP